jgi:hypothetical protein
MIAMLEMVQEGSGGSDNEIGDDGSSCVKSCRRVPDLALPLSFFGIIMSCTRVSLVDISNAFTFSKPISYV